MGRFCVARFLMNEDKLLMDFINFGNATSIVPTAESHEEKENWNEYFVLIIVLPFLLVLYISAILLFAKVKFRSTFWYGMHDSFQRELVTRRRAVTTISGNLDNVQNESRMEIRDLPPSYEEVTNMNLPPPRYSTVITSAASRDLNKNKVLLPAHL